MRVLGAREPLRCALCHDDLEEPLAVCEGCAAVLHTACRAALRRCPTLGCPERVRPRVELRARSRFSRIALGTFLALGPPSPLTLFAFGFGYTGPCDQGAPRALVPLCWFMLLVLGFLGVVTAATVGWLWRRRLGGVSSAVLAVVASWLTALSFFATREVAFELGERRELAPRIAPVRRALEHGERGAIPELGVLDVKRGASGFLLYRQHPGVYWKGFGLFLPDDPATTPRSGYPFVFDESSLPDVYYFTES